MVGDLRYFFNKLKRPSKKEFVKRYNVLSFKEDEINTFSRMEKCKLTVTDNELIIGSDVKYSFKDVVSIEKIDTKICTSNKGLVIKIAFSDRFVFCFSLGSYHFLPGQSASILSTMEIYDLLNEKYNKAGADFSS